MALVPGRQLCLESSFSKFHGTSLRLFRYSCSVPLKPHALYSYSPFDKNPPRKSISQMSPKKMDLSTSDWLSEWNKPSKRNRLKRPQAVFNYRSNQNMNGANGSTMERILENLKKHGYIDGDGNDKKEKEQERVIEKGSVEDIFYVEEGMLPNARGGFSKDSPLGIEDVFKSDGEVRFPWEKPKKGEEEGEEEGRWTARSKSRTNLAELTLPPSELRRLRQLTYQAKSRVKIKSRGVTQEVVDAIHEKWKTDEIVRLKVDGAPALNMKRVHEILERKTGGLVIWRNGTSISLYRGMSYEVPSMQLNKRMFKRNEVSTRSAPIEKRRPSAQDSIPVETGKIIKGPSLGEEHAHQSKSHTAAEDKEKKESKMSLGRIYEDKIDNLLEGLGPRYLDWPECDPLPVDADMLPGIVPGYQPPFRILPYGVRSTLGCKEATSVRRLARVLPPHFALGRSRHLQGLAVAIIKLWEKSSIAKIALKRGVQLTTSERMAEDIKKLTGGLLVSRNKDFLVFYRGKNFLSPDVSEALLEKERLAKSLQDEEERARSKSLALVTSNVEIMEEAGTAGTLEETLDANARWGKLLDDSHKESIMREAELERRANLVRKLENKLAFSERRLMKAKQALSKVEAFLQPSPRQADPESISDEERFMFRKLGLKMQAFALLGRRGVFDGTVENMHLHWKYRELVKIILKAKNFEQVKKIALALEAESGGILVSVDKVSKGYAIIVYRGKDYQRPSTLRPKNLLTKRKALARSKEIQRHEALLSHVSALQNKVEKLRSEIHQMAALKDQGNNKLYERLDSSYPTDDDDETEKEGNEAYLEAYNSENGVDYDDADFGDNDDDVNDKTEKRVQDVQLRFDFPSSFQDQESETELEDENEAYVERYDGDNDGVLPMPNGDLLQKVHANLPPNARNHVSTNPSS